MAKIFFCDYTHHKTTRHWLEWLKQNHEVIVDMYFNPLYAQWADVIWIEWCEGAAVEASQMKGHYENIYDHAGVCGNNDKSHQHSGDFDWSGKKIIIRPIDIDVHYGHFRKVKWENVDSLFYIAPHILDLMSDFHFPETLKKVHTPLSVDLDEWKFRERHDSGRNIAWINHSWTCKGLPLALQGLEKLIRVSGDRSWKLHIVENGRSNEYWLWSYLYHIIEELGLKDNVIWYKSVGSVDEFLEDKDYLWQTSFKEGFSLIVAEALAKGIKALTHNWRDSRLIWGDEIVWSTIDELVEKMLDGKYDSQHYREIVKQYSKEKEVELLRKLTNL